MNIYLIHLEGKKYKQYKTFEDAESTVNKFIDENPKILIEIFIEEYCEFGHAETSCKTYLLLKYDNGKLNKYI